MAKVYGDYLGEMLRIDVDEESTIMLNILSAQINAAFRQLEPGGLITKHLHRVIVSLREYMVMIVHVITGRLRASIYPYMNEAELYGGVATSVSYAAEESLRPGAKTHGTPPYGGHDFLMRTIEEEQSWQKVGEDIAKMWADELTRGLPIS